MPTIRSDYVAPRWLPGAHLQTVVPARFFPRPHVSYRRELIDMPDGDFMTFDWVKPEPEALTETAAISSAPPRSTPGPSARPLRAAGPPD